MRGTLWTRLVFLSVVGFALGCGERPQQSDEEADTELVALEERAEGLRERLTNGPAPELRAEFQDLVADVEAWQARSGRSDLAVTTDSTRGPATGTAARDDGGGGGDDSCPSCPGYNLSADEICFLTEEGSCPDPDDEVLAGRICVYQCIWIGSGPAPARGAEAAE